MAGLATSMQLAGVKAVKSTMKKGFDDHSRQYQTVYTMKLNMLRCQANVIGFIDHNDMVKARVRLLSILLAVHARAVLLLHNASLANIAKPTHCLTS